MTLRLVSLALLVALAVPWAFACEEEASDAERSYLESFCRAMDDFSDEVAEASSAGALRSAFDALIENLGAVDPPPSLAQFHADFSTYLREAAGHPGTTSVSEVPRPPSEVRSRLTSIERDVPGCRAPTPFRSEN